MMKQIINIDINDEIHEVAVEKSDTLIRVLRERLGLLATKRGCDSGGCGCCTVLVDGQAVYSCMTFALSLEGKKITTVEGLPLYGQPGPVPHGVIGGGAGDGGFCT